MRSLSKFGPAHYPKSLTNAHQVHGVFDKVPDSTSTTTTTTTTTSIRVATFIVFITARVAMGPAILPQSTVCGRVAFIPQV